MIDGAGCHFVVAGESGENRQTRRIGRRPRVGPLLVDGHVPDGGRISTPFPTLQCCFVEFVQPATVFFQYEDMAVTVAGLRVTLNQRIGWNRLGPRITFIRKSSESYSHLGLRPGNHLIRNTNCLVVEGTGTEVRMQGDGGSDEVNDVAGIGIDWRDGNVGIPQTA